LKKNQNFNWKPISTGNEKLLIILSWIIVVIIVILLSIYFSGEQKSIEGTSIAGGGTQEITSDGRRDIREGTVNENGQVTGDYLDQESLRDGEVFTIQVGKPDHLLDEAKALTLEKEYKTLGLYSSKMMGDFERKLYLVMVGTFKDGASARKFEEKVKEKGFPTRIVKMDEPGRAIAHKGDTGGKNAADVPVKTTESKAGQNSTLPPAETSGTSSAKGTSGWTPSSAATSSSDKAAASKDSSEVHTDDAIASLISPKSSSSEATPDALADARKGESAETRETGIDSKEGGASVSETPASSASASPESTATSTASAAPGTPPEQDDDTIVISGENKPIADIGETPADVIKKAAETTSVHVETVGASKKKNGDKISENVDKTSLGLEYEGEFDGESADPISATLRGKGKAAATEVKNGEAEKKPESSKNVEETPAAKEATENDSGPRTSAAGAESEPVAESDVSDGTGKFAVQVGTYKQKENAERMLKILKDGGYTDARVDANKKSGAAQYCVRVGSFDGRTEASDFMEKLKNYSTEIKSPWVIENKKKE
jgi:colicin import membrane protein